MSRGRQRRLSYNSATCFSHGGQVLPVFEWAIAGNKWLAKRPFGTKTSADLKARSGTFAAPEIMMMGASRLEPSHFNCKLLPIHLGHGQAFGTDGSATCTLGMLHLVKDRQLQAPLKVDSARPSLA
jgi:hypothetical protein